MMARTKRETADDLPPWFSRQDRHPHRAGVRDAGGRVLPARAPEALRRARRAEGRVRIERGGRAEGAGAGRLLIDEKNGFLIDNCLSGGALYSRFTVNGNLVTTCFELRGEVLDVELTMLDVSKPRVTKLTGGNFEVTSFSPKYVQCGILRRERPARKDGR